MPSPNLDPSLLMKDVYSYPFPEVREVLGELALRPEFLLNTLPVDVAGDYLKLYGFQPPLELTSNPDGSLNHDELHLPVIERIRGVVGAAIRGLGLYENAYPIPGSNQAIFTLMAEWRATGKLSSVAVLEGEYDGYAANAQALRIPVQTYPSLEESEPQKGQVWFVSNPNARVGNWLDDDEWNAFTHAGHQIVYDAAYAGLTPPREVDASSENIQAILTSPSKIFGVFRNRYTGVTYTREPVNSLYSTKWFKSIPGLMDTLKLYEEFGRNELPLQYRGRQEMICQQLGELVRATVVPSDVLLLGHTTEQVSEEFRGYARAGAYRFGFAKLFEAYERQP